MQLSKTQVIALLIGYSQATTVASVMNGSADAGTTTLTGTQKLTTKSSLTKCDNGAADCTVSTESCAQVQLAAKGNTAASKSNACVYKYYCGTVGRIAGQDFAAPCWTGTNAPAARDAAADIKALEGIVLPATKTFAGATYDNFKVLSIDKFQTGWWVLGSDSKWTETDKAVNNACTANSACTTGQCCAGWPDTNSRKCIDKTLGGKSQSVGPITFTPTCAVDTNAPPQSAASDLAGKAKAKAAGELKSWVEARTTALKTEAGYDKMSATDQAAWDKARNAALAKREAFQKADRTAAGIDKDCNDACETVYGAELLQWKKDVYEACKKDKDSIECTNADDIRKKMVERMSKGKFFTKDATTRKAWKEADKAEGAKAKSAILAAATSSPAYKKQIAKDDCKVTTDKKERCASTHCCGTAVPVTTGKGTKRDNVCVAKTAAGKYTDFLGREYTHTCGAKALLASVSALFAAASLM